MPVYNGERWLREAIESVLDQTYRNFEFLIVDDGSTDGTPRILAEYAARDDRIRVITQENKGVSRSLNEALPLARHDWIAHLDADDLALPNRLERQCDFIEQHPGVAVAACDADYIDERGTTVGRHVNPFRSRAAVERWLAKGRAIYFIHSGVIMRRDVVLEAGGYRPEFELSHDTDLWNRVAERGRLVLAQPEVLVQYRIHERGMTRHSFLQLARELRWLEACANQRRRGRPEPSFGQFREFEARLPWPRRLNILRRDCGQVSYKSATVSRTRKDYPALALHLGAATLLDPLPTLGKVWSKAIRSQLPALFDRKQRSR
jgi:glycosyltransferase involved in cell wall biosynthesis